MKSPIPCSPSTVPRCPDPRCGQGVCKHERSAALRELQRLGQEFERTEMHTTRRPPRMRPDNE